MNQPISLRTAVVGPFKHENFRDIAVFHENGSSCAARVTSTVHIPYRIVFALLYIFFRVDEILFLYLRRHFPSLTLTLFLLHNLAAHRFMAFFIKA